MRDDFPDVDLENGGFRSLNDRTADRMKDCRACAAKVAFYMGTRPMDRKVCADD